MQEQGLVALSADTVRLEQGPKRSKEESRIITARCRGSQLQRLPTRLGLDLLMRGLNALGDAAAGFLTTLVSE